MKQDRIIDELEEWRKEMEQEKDIGFFLWKSIDPSLLESIEHIRKAIEHVQAVCN